MSNLYAISMNRNCTCKKLKPPGPLNVKHIIVKHSEWLCAPAYLEALGAGKDVNKDNVNNLFETAALVASLQAATCHMTQGGSTTTC